MIGDSSFFFASIRTLFSLALVLGLFYLLMRILLKFSSRGFGGNPAGKKPIIVIGKLNLSPKKSIYLVKLGKKILLIGVNGGVHLLYTIEDEETLALFQTKIETRKSEGFFQILKNLVSHRD